MATEMKLNDFVALGHIEGRPSHYPKFRWLFPLFYTMTTVAFVALILYRAVTGQHIN